MKRTLHMKHASFSSPDMTVTVLGLRTCEIPGDNGKTSETRDMVKVYTVAWPTSADKAV